MNLRSPLNLRSKPPGTSLLKSGAAKETSTPWGATDGQIRNPRVVALTSTCVGAELTTPKEKPHWSKVQTRGMDGLPLLLPRWYLRWIRPRTQSWSLEFCWKSRGRLYLVINSAEKPEVSMLLSHVSGDGHVPTLVWALQTSGRDPKCDSVEAGSVIPPSS